MCKIMCRKFSDSQNKKGNLSKVYDFKNDFNLDLKSSRVPASTISLDKLFQSFTTLIKKECLKRFIFEDFQKRLSDQLSQNVLQQIQKILRNLNWTDQKQSYNIPPVKNKYFFQCLRTSAQSLVELVEGCGNRREVKILLKQHLLKV